MQSMDLLERVSCGALSRRVKNRAGRRVECLLMTCNDAGERNAPLGQKWTLIQKSLRFHENRVVDLHGFPAKFFQPGDSCLKQPFSILVAEKNEVGCAWHRKPKTLRRALRR